MSTIGRHHTGTRRDMTQHCAYCDVVWLMSEMRQDGNGFWACPDDQDGRTSREIDGERAIDSAEPTALRSKGNG
jgi:hypothetical protein